MHEQATIFVVDDDPAFRNSLGALLQITGVPCEFFESGEAFLESFDTSLRGCLILDVRMPGADGFDVVRALNEQKSTLPIILVSGHEDQLSDSMTTLAGVLRFLQKPFDPDEFLALIKEVMSESQRDDS